MRPRDGAQSTARCSRRRFCARRCRRCCDVPPTTTTPQTQDLYVAVTKATIADEAALPKEKHVATLKLACGALAPRSRVEYVAYKLSKRVASPCWVTALKALMVFHRLMRECDASLLETLALSGAPSSPSACPAWRRGGGLGSDSRFGGAAASRPLRLALERFEDAGAGRGARDLSAWVRVYSLFLDARLEAFRAARFDPDVGASGARRSSAGGAGGVIGGGPAQGFALGGGRNGGHGGPSAWYAAPLQPQPQPAVNAPNAATADEAPAVPPPAPATRSLRDCGAAELLDRLPAVQRLMLRAVACVPEGAAAAHPLCLTAAAWALRDARAVYRAASGGVINLADRVFAMARADAARALELYRAALALHDRLSAYFGSLQAIAPLRCRGGFGRLRGNKLWHSYVYTLLASFLQPAASE